MSPAYHIEPKEKSSLSPLSILAILCANACVNAFETRASIEWTGGESVAWSCPATRRLYRSDGKFVGKNLLATRVAVRADDAYVALPRFKRGIPFTLGKLSSRKSGCEARLTPFPSWSLNEEGDCTALQSVVDLFLDADGDVLWVLDTGIVNVLDDPTRRCSPKLVALNVSSGKLVKSIDLSRLSTNSSRLQYLVADRGYLYVSDAANRAILALDASSGHGYRLALPRAVSEGCARRDVLTIALIRRTDASYLVFTYLSGKRLFYVKTDYLRSARADGRIVDVGRKTGRFVFLGTDGASAIFFRREGESGVYRSDLFGCPARNRARKVYEGCGYRLPTHVVPDYGSGRMRVLESNFPDYFQGCVGCGAEHALAYFS